MRGENARRRAGTWNVGWGRRGQRRRDCEEVLGGGKGGRDDGLCQPSWRCSSLHNCLEADSEADFLFSLFVMGLLCNCLHLRIASFLFSFLHQPVRKRRQPARSSQSIHLLTQGSRLAVGQKGVWIGTTAREDERWGAEGPSVDFSLQF